MVSGSRKEHEILFTIERAAMLLQPQTGQIAAYSADLGKIKIGFDIDGLAVVDDSRSRRHSEILG